MNHIEKNGIDLYYRINGAVDGFPIIFIHGLAGDSRFFHNQLKFFGKSYKTIAIDLPGHGRSSFVTEQSMNLYNKSIETVVKREKIDKYFLAGHSMGGLICIENYLRNKDKVKALILISTSTTLPVSSMEIDYSNNDFDNFFNKMLLRIFHKKAGIFILAAQRSINENEKKIITGDLKLCSGLDYNEQLKEIETPVLLVANRHDEMIPAAMTEEMREKIKDSKIVIFENEGHVPFFENSSEFNTAMNDFIELIQQKPHILPQIL